MPAGASATSQAAARISAIASSLSSPSVLPMATAKRPPITCHILDTTTGTPAPGVTCTLVLTQSATTAGSGNIEFSALTDEDGRVGRWQPSGAGSQELEQVLDKTQATHWKITFEIGAYYTTKGITSFFPKVDINFVTGGPGQEGREHYHVPLLVGPYNYTTYRGS